MWGEKNATERARCVTWVLCSLFTSNLLHYIHLLFCLVPFVSCFFFCFFFFLLDSTNISLECNEHFISIKSIGLYCSLISTKHWMYVGKSNISLTVKIIKLLDPKSAIWKFILYNQPMTTTMTKRGNKLTEHAHTCDQIWNMYVQCIYMVNICICALHNCCIHDTNIEC